MARRGCFLSLTAIAVSVLPLAATGAAAAEREQPVLVTAEELIHDEKEMTTTARGKVELVHGERVLLADKVVYDQRADRVVAIGEVALLEPGGDILTAEYVELSDKLKSGFIKNLHAFLTDGSRLAAARHTRRGAIENHGPGRVHACKPCEDNAEAPPLWQIKALRVIHDEQARHDLSRSLVGVLGTTGCLSPVLFPSRPDREAAERLVGATVRSIRASRGDCPRALLLVDRPRPRREVEPIVYSKSGGILRSRYRQHLGHGKLDLSASVGGLDDIKNGAETGGSSWQGHMDLEGRSRSTRPGAPASMSSM